MLIHLNSEDRVSGTNEEPTFDFTALGSHHTRGGGTISVRNVELPFTWYNIETGTNNKFIYTDSNVVSKVIYINGNSSSGSPSASAALTAILAQLNVNTDGAVWTGSLNTNTARFTLTSTKTCNLSFTTVVADPLAYKVLGVDSARVIAFVANTPLTLPLMVNFNPYPFMLVKCNLPIQSGHDFDSFTNNVGETIAKVTVIGNPFSNTFYEPREREVREVGGLSGQYTFRLCNKFNKMPNLNGIPWAITLDFQK